MNQNNSLINTKKTKEYVREQILQSSFESSKDNMSASTRVTEKQLSNAIMNELNDEFLNNIVHTFWNRKNALSKSV